MTNRRFPRQLLGMMICLTCSSSISLAQPWDTFVDAVTDAQCEVINTDNAELVVLSETGQLVIVTARDVTLVDTFVDLDGNVFFEGGQTGFVTFADDGDGFRSLWWTALTGQVVALDPFTSEPTVSDSFPEDFFDVPCDACPFWDDPLACSLGCTTNADCDDDNPCTVDLCIAEDCFYIDVIGSCDDGLFCTTLDTCVEGLCVGIGSACPFMGCDEVEEVCFDSGLPPIVLCGSNMALTMSLSLMGLMSMRLMRPRFR